MDDQDIVPEFLIESSENIGRLDNEKLSWSAGPRMRICFFRTVHTIKGTCVFLGFGTLEALTHEAETILGQLRAGEREGNSSLVSLVLGVIDATRAILRYIETTGNERPDRYEHLFARCTK